MAKIREDQLGLWTNYNGQVTRPVKPTKFQLDAELQFVNYVGKNGDIIFPWIYVMKYSEKAVEPWLISNFSVSSYITLNKYLYNDVFFNILKIDSHLESTTDVAKYQTKLFLKILDFGSILNLIDSKQTKKTLAQEDQIFNIVDTINLYVDILIDTLEISKTNSIRVNPMLEITINTDIIKPILLNNIINLDVTGLTARDSILKLIEYFNIEIKPISVYLNTILNSRNALSNKKQTFLSLKKKLLKDEKVNLIF